MVRGGGGLSGLVVWLLAFGVTLLVCVRYIDYYTLDIGGYDENVMQATLRARQVPFYTSPAHPPFGIVQYGPVHMLFIGNTCRLRSLPAKDVQSAYVVNSIMVLALNLLACYVLYRFGRTMGIHALLSVGMSAFFFADLTVFYHGRPDPLYILLYQFALQIRPKMRRYFPRRRDETFAGRSEEVVA